MSALRDRLANGVPFEQAVIETLKEEAGIDLTNSTITLSWRDYLELVESHNHLYLSMGIMNPNSLGLKKMIKAAEICEKHKPK